MNLFIFSEVLIDLTLGNEIWSPEQAKNMSTQSIKVEGGGSISVERQNTSKNYIQRKFS